MADQKIVEKLREVVDDPMFKEFLERMWREEREEYQRRLNAFWDSPTRPFVVTI